MDLEESKRESEVIFRGQKFDLGREALEMLDSLLKSGIREHLAIKEVLDHYGIKYPEWYESKKGFETVPIHRGFTEVRRLYEVITPLGAFLCGGYVRWMASPHLNPIPAGDVDVYCRNEDTYDKVVEALESKGLEKRHENEVSKTYQRSNSGEFRACPPIQVIKPIKQGSIMVKGYVQDILENFDFTVIRAALVTRDQALVDADYLHDETLRILRIKNIHCPISSTLRFCKYCDKGYWAPPMQITKLFQDWDNRSEDYKDKILQYLESAEQMEGLTKEQVNELEGLMRVD